MYGVMPGVLRILALYALWYLYSKGTLPYVSEGCCAVVH